ncbi:MAG: hypothetical protein CVV64_02975 [Candidatus Wallbacteria bacterium HGW-Wallbacteria-1]|uniref:Penicillin-binding protein activator LpoB n=1 Tax=Candidatus Wallbacteria bacterium HGW-Wallbacteria-1 TaxID=2013854 RepID=A0A2N1PTG4_9BACT|nr:MAG: hypothetical protein CVV64_02975 [Candidatus Wallbacteria bacterium HGW-Wallbacteria-1]
MIFFHLFLFHNSSVLAREATGDLSFDLKRVAVLRFVDRTPVNLAIRVQELASERFRSHGYFIIPPRSVRKAEWSNNVYDTSALTPREVTALGKALKADILVGGTIEEFKGEKAFRLGNLMAMPLGVGFVLYGKIVLRAVIYDVSTGQSIWKNSVVRTKKHFFGGLYQGHGAVLDKAMTTALDFLFGSFFQKDF